MKAIIVSLTLVLITPLFFNAQDHEEIDEHLDSISGEFAQCAAYYELVYQALISSNENETANVFKERSDDAIFYSLLLANLGRSKYIAINVTNSRIKMSLEIMKQEINNRNENISILITKYHFNCEELIKHPPEELTEVFKKRVNYSLKQLKI